jgi:hypothetical protein
MPPPYELATAPSFSKPSSPSLSASAHRSWSLGMACRRMIREVGAMRLWADRGIERMRVGALD